MEKIADRYQAEEAMKKLIQLEEETRRLRAMLTDFYNPSHHPWVKIDWTLVKRELLNEPRHLARVKS